MGSLYIKSRLCILDSCFMGYELSIFMQVIPKRYISAFTPNELSLLLSGIPSIDVKDWKSNTTVRAHVSTINHSRYYLFKTTSNIHVCVHTLISCQCCFSKAHNFSISYSYS